MKLPRLIRQIRDGILSRLSAKPKSKWPSQIVIIRHAPSAYNDSKAKKQANPDYQRFMRTYNRDCRAPQLRQIAEDVRPQLALNISDWNTPLADGAFEMAVLTGQGLAKEYGHLDQPPFDIVFVSPYRRTKDTLRGLIEGWPALAGVEVVEEERIREQEHGLANLYNDRYIFFTFHPEQRELFDLEGPYHYRWPQGESVQDVRDRVRSFLNTLSRDYAGQRVLVVTHHLLILSFMANIDRWDSEIFARHDHDPVTKPANCGVYAYECDETAGRRGQGKLRLTERNRIYY